MFERDLPATFMSAEFNVLMKTSGAGGDPKQKRMISSHAKLTKRMRKVVNLWSQSDACSGGGGGGGTEMVPCETGRFFC
jgi:hypothetical protein